MPDGERFVLWRIIGNDLPPRHDVGSVQDNLVFTLDHEPSLPGVERRWWLNRLVDDGQLAALTAELDRRGAHYHIDPFDEARYREADGRYEKIQAAVNINGVRNAILNSPACNGAYALPFDGSTFFTSAAWSRVRADLATSSAATPTPTAFAVPMARVARRAELFEDIPPTPTAEPQLLFAPGHTHRFDERYPYGFRDKVSFLVAMGRIPGYLREDDVPLHERHVYGGDPTRCPDVGYVFRLPSADVDKRSLEPKERMLTREDAIDAFLAELDARLGIVPPWTWSEIRAAREAAPRDVLLLDGSRPYDAVWNAFRRHEQELTVGAYLAVSGVDLDRRSKGGIRFLNDHVIGTRRYRPVRYQDGVVTIQRIGPRA